MNDDGKLNENNYSVFRSKVHNIEDLKSCSLQDFFLN